ncbi:MAG TPA: S24/S26 family peptidase [Acidothermaceae bacterium]
MASPRPEDVAALVRSSAGDGVWLPVDGSSMLPTISAGSQVRVVSVSRRPRIAEIWAFCDPNGEIIVHRYRRQDHAQRFVFRGDNVKQSDMPVDAERLIGVVRVIDANGTKRAAGWLARVRWIAHRAGARIRR